MKPITFDKTSYFIDGKPAFLYSGEFHYFRVRKTAWRERMERFREAGGNCIATYIPWLIHEPKEGQFALQGENHLDVEEFLVTLEKWGWRLSRAPVPINIPSSFTAAFLAGSTTTIPCFMRSESAVSPCTRLRFLSASVFPREGREVVRCHMSRCWPATVSRGEDRSHSRNSIMRPWDFISGEAARIIIPKQWASVARTAGIIDSCKNAMPNSAT